MELCREADVQMARSAAEAQVPDMDTLGYLEDVVYLEDDECLVLDGLWWRLEPEDSAIARLRPRPIRQALIGQGEASREGVEVRYRLSEVIGGPFILAHAVDADAGNALRVATASDHVELARLYGEILESIFVSGHDYTFSGTSAVILP